MFFVGVLRVVFLVDRGGAVPVGVHRGNLVDKSEAREVIVFTGAVLLAVIGIGAVSRMVVVMLYNVLVFC